MNSRTSAMVVVAVLALSLLAGVYATENLNLEKNERNVTIETCDSLPDYDYERMVERVEDIKGEQLGRNISICVEQKEKGIDTTPSQGQFARIEEPGLSFFGLDATTNSQQRSSLGHTELSPSGGPVEIFLANESVVENVSWISYEGLVVHELSHAVELPGEVPDNVTVNHRTSMQLTTDEMLARQAISNGVAMHVTELYVERYGGWQNVSALAGDTRNWKRRVVQSVYASGYRYSKRTDRRTVPRRSQVNSTAQILHPNETVNVTEFPPRPNLSMASLEHVRTDRVGELFLQGTFESKGLDTERAAAAADGWANDRMDYYRANGSAVVAWRVVWESADEQAEFLDAYDAVYDYEQVETLASVDCGNAGRYLTASEETVTVLRCGS